MLKAIDLGCGAGGWACAARGLPIRWVAVADLAEDCLETWSLNHSTAHPGCALVHRDLTERGVSLLIRKLVKAAGGVDLIVGAIPCEQLSRARGGHKLKPGDLDSLHALIDVCFGIVRRLAPRWWCFEDVTAIEGHLPLALEWGAFECRQIQARDYGPQSRLRTFFGKFSEPAPAEAGPRTLGEVLRLGPYRTLRHLADYERSRHSWYGGKTMRTYEDGEPAPTLTSAPGKSSTNERGFMVPLVRVLDADQPCPTVTPMGAKGDRAALVELPPSIQDRPQDAAQAAPTVVSGHGDRMWPVRDGNLVRCLEWQEAAALQGFPDDYVFTASWSRTWKMVAQAIPIQVGRAILQAICAEAGHAPTDE